MAANMKLYEQNSQQKHKAICIGRDTTIGQHVTVSQELGKVLSKKLLRLTQDQFTRDFMLKTMELQPNDKTHQRTDKDMDHIPRQPELPDYTVQDIETVHQKYNVQLPVNMQRDRVQR
eukprot:3304471-Amphidinium_carterae.1